MSRSEREKRCVWCGLSKFGDNRCICDDPRYEEREPCADCGGWTDPDKLWMPKDAEGPLCHDCQIAADGGVGRRDHPKLAHRWGNRAEENIQKWGNQPPKELLLAMAEEMAEIADELLEDGGLPPNAYESEAHTILNDIRTVGYWAREHLEENYESDDGEPLPDAERPDLTGVANPEAATEETEDLAPLLFQLYWALNDCEVSPATERSEDGGQR